MRGIIRKLIVAALLALCVGIYALELSGRWDQTLQDANDEAALVAVVLCVGFAVAGAHTILKQVAAGTVCRLVVFAPPPPFRFSHFLSSRYVEVSSPPLAPLRV